MQYQIFQIVNHNRDFLLQPLVGFIPICDKSRNTVKTVLESLRRSSFISENDVETRNIEICANAFVRCSPTNQELMSYVVNVKRPTYKPIYYLYPANEMAITKKPAPYHYAIKATPQLYGQTIAFNSYGTYVWNNDAGF